MHTSGSAFFKTTIIGGLVVVIPLSLIIIIFGDLFLTLMEITEPAAKYLPFNDLINTLIVACMAVIGILVICFLTGILVRTSWGIAGKDWFETNVLNRIPMYSMIKNLTSRYVGEDGTSFTPAEIDLFGSDARVLGLIVEELVDGRVSVYVPITPAATIGQVYFLPSNRVRKLEATLGATINTISEWGTGTDKLFN